MRIRPRIIDQDGHEIDERPPGLRAVWEMIRPRREPDEESTLTMRRINTGPDDLQGIARMPFTVTRARDLVRLRFEALGREMDRLARMLSGGYRRLAWQNDQRMDALEARLEALAARQRTWIAREEGHAMAEAYALGGTELVEKITPALIARMDALALAAS